MACPSGARMALELPEPGNCRTNPISPCRVLVPGMFLFNSDFVPIDPKPMIRALIDKATLPLLVIDQQGRFQYANRGAEILTGYRRRELLAFDPAGPLRRL